MITEEHPLEHSLRLIEEAQAESDSKYRDQEYRDGVSLPPELEVTLPGGLWDIDGSVRQDAEVRELNGFDEEALVKVSTQKSSANSRILEEILLRCTIRVGDEKMSRDVLERLFIGDWDALLLAIRIASFGRDVTWNFRCPTCMELRKVDVDLVSDVEMSSPSEQTFEYRGKRSRYLVGYPRGGVNREVLALGSNPSTASVITETLYGSILEIDGRSVDDKRQVMALPTLDRESLMKEIGTRMPTVKLGEVKKPCPVCEEEATLTLTLAALFQGRVPGL